MHEPFKSVTSQNTLSKMIKIVISFL